MYITKLGRYYVIAIVLLLASGTATYSDTDEQHGLNERIQLVEKLINQASENNGLWRETRYLSNRAMDYSKNKDYASANQLLLEAEFQARQGIQQALAQTDLNQLLPGYLRN